MCTLLDFSNLEKMLCIEREELRPNASAVAMKGMQLGKRLQS
jgi:hypothetical protein